MAAPKKVRFYSKDPEKNPEIQRPVYVWESGMTEMMSFENGVFETSNPLYIAELERWSWDPDSPISTDPPKSKKEAKS